MKARKPSGQILIIFETDLSQAKSLDEEKLTPIQKAVYDKLSENQKGQIKQGYGAVYRDIDTDTEICSFNMDCYKAPKLPDYLVRSIIESCRKFYSNPENRAALSRKHTEATKAKLRSRIFSTETREKMSKSHYDCSGLKNPSAKAIVQLSLSGELIREYGYANQASKECNLDLSSIIKCCRGKQKTCGGYRWKYK